MVPVADREFQTEEKDIHFCFAFIYHLTGDELMEGLHTWKMQTLCQWLRNEYSCFNFLQLLSGRDQNVN